MKRIGLTALTLAAAGFLAATAHAQDMKNVAISTIVEVPALVDTKTGILEGLAEKGFVEGETITVDYQNANGNMPTQQQIAKKFVGENPDIIIPITTPTAQAVIAATSDIPIVFTSVTDPLKAKLVERFEKPGGNVTGVSDAAPIKQQIDLMAELIPGMKTIGFVYNPGLDNAVAALENLKEQAGARGIEVVASAAPTTNEVVIATRKLIGNVDAIYIPNDTTVVSALESIVKIGEDVDLPVFTGETSSVARGVVASVGINYLELGRITGHMAARILNGEDPGEMDVVVGYEALSDFDIAINTKAAAEMGVEVPESVLERASQIVE